MNRFTFKLSSIILFFLRLFFYFSVIVLIFIHPGIPVSFDRIGVIQWFIIFPLMAVIAFQPSGLRRKILLALILLVPLSVIATGFSTGALTPILTGFISFFLTLLLFHRNLMPLPLWFSKIAALEPFFLAWICLRLLSLSRSGEDIAAQSSVLTQFILVWTLAVFLFHGVVVYLCLYPKSRAGSWKEGLVFISGAFAVLAVMLVVLPHDFVNNLIIENLISDRIPQRIDSGTDKGLPQRGGGRRTLPEGDNGRGELRGLSEYEWPGSGGDNRQYMVKIVASSREPVYMGDSFRGSLDPVNGFLTSPQEPLNDLAGQRFFVTWFNNERSYDLGRVRQEVFSLSTLRHKYFPWRPYSADPIILHDNAGPLRYIHQVVSDIHPEDSLFLVNTRTRLLSSSEKTALAPYLEITLEESDRIQFESFINSAFDNWKKNRGAIIENDRYLKSIFVNADVTGNTYLENIIALMVSFYNYQYNLSVSENHSIAAIKEFLFNNKEGDCTEFSNTLALLGRLAGIPSRVVTGYLAAESLQTPAHLNGLAMLQKQIPVLQEFPFEYLFMVTNLHSHSWAQFYIPGYGWIDFEATSFAIPPMGMGDFNNWDVVIPILDENRTFSQVKKFPWQAAGRAAIALAVLAVICAYLLRYGREIILYAGSQKGGRSGARSLYLLLLARLAADGQPIKPASKTAHEYAELFLEKRDSLKETRRSEEENLHLKAFANIYSEIRWREYKKGEEMNERFALLKQEYHNILKLTKMRGLHHALKRVFSLRGLSYL